MSVSKKTLKNIKNGFNASKRKTGINILRYYLSGIDKNAGIEKTFFIELEFLNPWLSPSEPQLGFKPRIKITEDDLQYALAGTASAQDLKAETIVQPSYIALRIGLLGTEPKQLCTYVPIKSVKFSNKPFSVQFGNNIFTDEQLSGYINISEEEHQKHPEYLCDKGFATWNLKYEIIKEYSEGYETATDKWFPCGMKTNITGMINFDGCEYLVEPRKCFGYMDRFWGKSMPAKWFHISTSNLTSIISGKTLFNSMFSIQGEFDNRISFIGSFEDTEILFCADSSKRQYTSVFNCVQTPEVDDEEENKLHWSTSIHSKEWVIDVDLFCKIKELYNRKLELPEGHRKVLNVVQGSTAIGEIKLFKKTRNTLEQIEYARIGKANCEFGSIEEAEE